MAPQLLTAITPVDLATVTPPVQTSTPTPDPTSSVTSAASSVPVASVSSSSISLNAAAILAAAIGTPSAMVVDTTPLSSAASATPSSIVVDTASSSSAASATPFAMVVDTSPPPLSLSQLLQIVPNSGDCKDAEFPNECVIADDALPAINAAFTNYGITHSSVRAALIATMAYESDSFKYNFAHKPDTPGKGTKAMLDPKWIKPYAEYLKKDTSGSDADVLGRVTDLQDSFGAAAWFLTQHCGFAFRQSLWGGGNDGWNKYVDDCLTIDPAEKEGRLAFYNSGLTVLGTN